MTAIQISTKDNVVKSKQKFVMHFPSAEGTANHVARRCH